MILFIIIFLSIIIFTRSKLIITTYVLISLLNLAHHTASFESGRDGYSILTKQILKDEIIYAKIPLELSNLNFLNISDYLNNAAIEQIDQIGYFSLQGTIYSYLNYLIFKLFGSSLFNLKIINSLFYALLVGVFRKIFIEFGIKKSYTIKYSIFLGLLPNLLIRSIQLEKDILIVLLTFYIIYMFIKADKIKFLKIFPILSILLFTRIYIFISLLITRSRLANRLFFKRNLLYQIPFALIFSSISILIIKIFFPQFFEQILAIKKYSVLVGVVGFLEPNYNDFLGTILTYIKSLYYYYFSPISIYTFQGGSSLIWKFLIIEPIMYFIFPFTYILANLKIIQKNKRLLLLFGLSILIACAVVTFESHFTSVMRKRIPSLLLISIIALVIRFKNKSTIT
tara:strand:- start:232 stop:1422 length:1191 start_codon:yes stop_codon:yes gene_type:complete